MIHSFASIYPLISYLKYRENSMTKLLFVDDGISFDSKLIRQKALEV